MNALDLLEKQNRINKLRGLILDIFDYEEKMPNIREPVEREGYLLTKISFTDFPNAVYLIADFTTKQIEHIFDIDNYTKEIYRNFDERSQIKNGILSGNWEN